MHGTVNVKVPYHETRIYFSSTSVGPIGRSRAGCGERRPGAGRGVRRACRRCARRSVPPACTGSAGSGAARARHGRRCARLRARRAHSRVVERRGYRPERGALRAFLMVCVRNEAISRKRSSPSVMSPPNSAPPRHAAFGIDVAERVAIRTALSTLAARTARRDRTRLLGRLHPSGDRIAPGHSARHDQEPRRTRAAQTRPLSEPTGFFMNHIDQEAELYALGMLDDDERARVDEHLTTCEACTVRVGEAESAVAALIDSTQVRPDDAARGLVAGRGRRGVCARRARLARAERRHARSAEHRRDAARHDGRQPLRSRAVSGTPAAPRSRPKRSTNGTASGTRSSSTADPAWRVVFVRPDGTRDPAARIRAPRRRIDRISRADGAGASIELEDAAGHIIGSVRPMVNPE